MTQDDEFYIGYEGSMPPGIARAVRTAVIAAAAAAAVLAVAFTVAQRPLAASRFEFGRARTVEGYLRRGPAPALLVRDRGAWRRLWLVSTGKFGAAAALGELEDGWVRLTGTLIERERWSMLEVRPGSAEAWSTAELTPPPAAAPAGRPATFVGEIVDSKCFLGVMNPGERTVHRDCATRCLSGGIPAMFSFRDDAGRAQLALLLTADGRPVADRLPDGPGRPVRLTGLLSGPDDALTFTLKAAR